VITGRRTFSAAQSLVNELEKYTEAIFVGEPTAENVSFFGDTKVETLPNSRLAIRLSYIWWQNANVVPSDKRQWTAPDISVELSSDDYFNGSDPVLDAILNYTLQAPLLNRMLDAISNSRIDQAVNIYDKYKDNIIHKYKSTEGLLNRLGYRLMSQKKYEEAIIIFELNTREYPRAWNVWDSLAEAYMVSGNMDLSEKYYKLTLALNPDNQNAKQMLEKIMVRK
jgi:tetratricopeptide (TPR) repeat protein